MTDMKRNVLVVGATGRTGKRVAARLVALGVAVRAASRTAPVKFDWAIPSTWRSAVEGCDAAYITYAPDIALPGAVEAISAFVDTALLAGLKRVVLLSGRGEPEAQRAEACLLESGADWTIVRASWFMQNFSENFFREGVMEGEVVFANGDTPEPFVDADDIADVAVASLLDDSHIGKIYEVTGPRLLSLREATREIAEILKRPIQYIDLPPQEYIDGLSQAGFPNEVVALLSLLIEEVLDGRNAQVANGVRQALGRDPRDFVDYVIKSNAAGDWGNVR